MRSAQLVTFLHEMNEQECINSNNMSLIVFYAIIMLSQKNDTVKSSICKSGAIANGQQGSYKV